MSYDLVLLPSGAAASPAEVDEYLTAQDGRPAVEAVGAIAAELDERNSELPEADSFLGAPAADGVLGAALFVSTPYDSLGHTRDLLFELGTPRGYAVWDPQLAWLMDPADSVVATVTHGGAGELPYLTRGLVEDWIPELGQPGPYLIVETGDQVYIQTYRHPDGHYDLEYRDGSADKHFAATATDPRIVADLIWGWATGDRSGFAALDWQKLSF
ncbi:hypothetical protein [Nocardia seriolae]|uniref:hypothetical protein n=1 Tax=Nocardia seriolae TaxID=37332 RepID=UPI00051A23ED|nr:hypothetical protein [Nocardia seriolae]MTJ60292.1 hypothetical protein [Nocardia seriolae]MTJ75475.1 hypothetical protein [Nocardia seriolae]MTJ85282.1 hypothetical protein [Nocardia seriolae]MTK29278.1 hypothetical protein [Nocardia seriolae]MTK38222.1 hypothetical protein [Nocardia seriolae]